jgi:uncharacterized protein YndB with AHSA1/START domain
MKIFKRILLWILILIVSLSLIAFFLPKKVYVERTTVINASPGSVYSLLVNLKTYDSWMTWNQIDPHMKKQYGDTTEGRGAWYKWQSDNANVGNGKLTIIEAIPSQKVITLLEFEGSDAAVGGWELKDKASATEVKWHMDADMGNNPVARWMGILVIDKMIGDEFNKGLVNLKKLAEGK